jgi:CBS domain containing-hemolysin-like protein
MDGLSWTWMLALGLPILVVHLFSIALTKALQSHSRSLLEERCEELGRAYRAHEVEHWAHKTERAAEALAVLTGLLLAALMGVAVRLTGFPSRVVAVILPVLGIGLLGYVIAGVIGKVFAEIIIDALWPLTTGLRALAAPLTFGQRQIERLVEAVSGRSGSTQRPAQLQVEVPIEDDADDDDDDEPDLPESARVVLQQAILLTRTDVGALMTPRSSIVSLPSTVTIAEAAATFRRTGLSRVPIFEESRDDIVGVLYAKDLFARMTETQGAHAFSPRDLVRLAFFVPESKNAYDLLEEMRRQRRHFAIVLDEYGSVAGVVSLEDLLEELVGAIDDEHDNPPPDDPVRELGGSRFDVDASLTLEELNERLDLDLPTDADFQTIGGLVFHELGRLPAKGDSVNAVGVAFTVAEVSDHTIRRLLIDTAPDGARIKREPSGSSK